MGITPDTLDDRTAQGKQLKILRNLFIGVAMLVSFVLFSMVHPPKRIIGFWDATPFDAAWWLIDHGIALFL